MASSMLYSKWGVPTVVGFSYLLSPTLGFAPTLGRVGTADASRGCVLRASSWGDDVEISRNVMLKNTAAVTAAAATVAGNSGRGLRGETGRCRMIICIVIVV